MIANNQRLLFDGSTGCPECGASVIELEIAESGECTRCRIALVRGCPTCSWETFARYFSPDGETPKRRRRKRATRRPGHPRKGSRQKRREKP